MMLFADAFDSVAITIPISLVQVLADANFPAHACAAQTPGGIVYCDGAHNKMVERLCAMGRF